MISDFAFMGILLAIIGLLLTGFFAVLVLQGQHVLEPDDSGILFLAAFCVMASIFFWCLEYHRWGVEVNSPPIPALQRPNYYPGDTSGKVTWT